ncbi:MAG: four helix bundle protein [Ignavibacteriae bacterium]|nr:four helix bundle protein [Ignavibacteriota bacterium]
MKKNIIQEKSFEFALEVIRLYKQLKNQNEHVISKQLLRSGTSIGANVEEAIGAQSKKDFINKMSVAYKESRETHYWLRLIKESNLPDGDFNKYLEKAEELNKIISSILKTSKEN